MKRPRFRAALIRAASPAIQRRQAQREWEGIPKPRPYRPKSRGTATRAQLEAIRQALIKMVNS